MNSAQQTTTLPASKPLGSEPAALAAAPWRRARVLPQHIALDSRAGAVGRAERQPAIP